MTGAAEGLQSLQAEASMESNGSWALGGMWWWWLVGLVLAVVIVWILRQLLRTPRRS